MDKINAVRSEDDQREKVWCVARWKPHPNIDAVLAGVWETSTLLTSLASYDNEIAQRA